MAMWLQRWVPIHSRLMKTTREISDPLLASGCGLIAALERRTGRSLVAWPPQGGGRAQRQASRSSSRIAAANAVPALRRSPFLEESAALIYEGRVGYRR